MRNCSGSAGPESLGHSSLPLCQFFIPTIEVQANGAAYRPPDIEVCDRVMRQGLYAFAMTVVAVNAAQVATSVFTQGINVPSISSISSRRSLGKSSAMHQVL